MKIKIKLMPEQLFCLICSPPVDQAMISGIEHGTRFVIDYEVKAIEKSLKLSSGWLIDGK